ncbi:MAG: exodeoxyribonuclease V subunit gamma, partial [Thermoleophilia bacterium]|nr:exodeoxyribonuclease V subunit gamma [Thermoleophilia bacterium]
ALEVVLGAPAALEEALIARVAAHRAADPLAPVDVLVGGVLQRPYLQRLMADRGPGVVNVRVSTLGELGLRLGADALARSGRRPLPALAERALTREVAAACPGYFAPVAHTPGFAEAAHRTLRELRQEGMGPGDVDPEAIESAAKADDLRGLITRHAAARAGCADGLDALAQADPARFDGAGLVVSGVWRLGAIARRLVAGIAARVPVVVLLPALHPAADQAHAELRDWLAGLGAVTTRLPDPPAAGALGHLRAHLFTPAGPAPRDDSVDLVSAPEPLAEVREAARLCLDWADAGVAFHEMAVAFRQAEVYRPLVEAVFAEAGIPVYLDDGPSLAERPVGRRILSLLDLVGSPLPRAEVMAFVSDGWMPRATRERYGGAPRSRWDAVSRRAGVVSGADEWAARLGAYAARVRAEGGDGPAEWREERAAAADSLAAFVADLATRLGAAPANANWGAMLDWLAPLIGELVEDAGPVLGYLEGLRELDRVLGPVTLARFMEAVRGEVRAMRAADLDEARQGAFGRRGVNVLDLSQLATLRFRAVAVLGLTERAFPPPPRQDPILLDAERRRLNSRGVTLPLRAEGPDPEPLGFALAVHAARERLMLSTRRAEEAGGRAQLPSVFFRMAAGAMEGRRVGAEEVEHLPTVRRLRAGRVGAPEPDRSLTRQERDRTLIELEPALGRALLERLEPRAGRADALRRARWGSRTLTRYDGVLEDPDAIAAVAARLAERPLSPTGLEQYAVCPYRHLLAAFLRARPVPEPEGLLRIDPPTRGSLIHAVLERFVGGLGRAPARADLPALMRIAAEELDRAEAEGLTGLPLLWAADRREIAEDLARWLDEEAATGGGFRAVAVEVPFGRPDQGGHPDALEVEVAGRTLRVAGRIDRIDHDGPDGAFRVVDYKSGSDRGLPDDGHLAGGQALQLPLYLLAGAMITGADPAAGEAAYHLVTRRGGFRRIAFAGEVLAARRADLDRVLGRIVGGIEAGDFHAEPGKNADSCRYCDYDALCDVGRLRTRARKGADPRIASFAAMREVE